MKRILIVDDSKMIVDILKRELYKTIDDIEVLSALTFKEGVKYILKYPDQIDVAILDLHLPDSKDSALIDIVQTNNIKSIVLSGILNEQSKKLIFENNCIIDCIAKDGKKSIKSVITSVNRELKNSQKHILLVDDSKMQLAQAEKILKKMNLNVTTAKDGQEACDILKANKKKFSLVLTDYNMPKLDGMDLTFRIRENFNKDELGIIVLSSNSDPEIASQFLKMGANDFINKPYNELEVMTRVNSNLDLIDLFEATMEMANKDFLTGAYNRRYFFEASKDIFSKGQSSNENLAIIMLDIDDFKNINDTYGHDVGDKVICSVVDILKDNLKENSLIARFGGEEFCVLLEDISLSQVEELFDTIRKKFEYKIVEIDDMKISFTVSIGISYGISMELIDMIKLADDQLYYSKENGKNRISIKII